MAAKMNYINGEWVPAKSGKTRQIINPATGDLLAEVADSAVEDVREAIAAAKESFYGPGEWRRMSASARSKKLLEVADEIEKISDELCKLESMNTGMTYNNAVGNIGMGEPAGGVGHFIQERQRGQAAAHGKQPGFGKFQHQAKQGHA